MVYALVRKLLHDCPGMLHKLPPKFAVNSIYKFIQGGQSDGDPDSKPREFIMLRELIQSHLHLS